MALKPSDALLVPKLRRAGIKMPIRTIQAARETKLPLDLAATLLLMESGGGDNVWGHDRYADGRYIFPQRSAGRLPVTRENVVAYLRERDRGGKGRGGMQGLGVTQLTWHSFQDAAEKLGGAEKPLNQMRVGFGLLKSYVQRLGTERGFAAYNGSGPAADQYGRTAMRRLADVRKALGTGSPKRVPHPSTPGWKSRVQGDVQGLDQRLLDRLAAVARERGDDVVMVIRSGRRTRAEQEVLYAKYLRDGWPIAARPGTSRHETGRAADTAVRLPDRRLVNVGDDPMTKRLLAKHGLVLPVRGESWHVELAPGT